MKRLVHILAGLLGAALLLGLGFLFARQDYETFTHKYPQATFTDWIWDSLNGR